MRVLVSTVGSRGDVQPFLALAVALRHAGHTVTLATHARFGDWVRSHGVSHATLPGDPRTVIASEAGRDLLRRGVGTWRFARRFGAVLRPWFDSLVDALTPLHETADAAVYSPLTFPSWHLAQAAGIPSAFAGLQPIHRTGEFSSVVTGGRPLGTLGNLASHLLTEQLFWQPLRRDVNRWRSERLDLPPLEASGPWKELSRTAEPEFVAVSPTLVRRPADWPRRVHMTGAWRLASPGGLPAELADFLADGPPPIYAGFGSMADEETERLSEVVVGAARRHGRRVVLGSGWAGLESRADDVFVAEDVPHAWLFPRVEAAVHHGGAGTTHTALGAGIPSVVVPFFADQPFWGRRIEAVGCGPAPVPRRRLDEERLTRALAVALEPGVRRRAKVLGRRARLEPGTGPVVRWVDRIAGGRTAAGQ